MCDPWVAYPASWPHEVGSSWGCMNEGKAHFTYSLINTGESTSFEVFMIQVWKGVLFITNTIAVWDVFWAWKECEVKQLECEYL